MEVHGSVRACVCVIRMIVPLFVTANTSGNLICYTSLPWQPTKACDLSISVPNNTESANLHVCFNKSISISLQWIIKSFTLHSQKICIHTVDHSSSNTISMNTLMFELYFCAWRNASVPDWLTVWFLTCLKRGQMFIH